MSIGEKIKIARDNAGLTQEELGKKCGTTKQTIFKYETGVVTNIPIDRLEAIADAVNVSAAWLLGWEEEQPTGVGELSDAEMEIIRLFRQLPPEAQDTFPALLEASLKAGKLL